MINNVVISNTVTDILTTTASQSFAGIGLYFCNTSDTDETFSLHAVETGGEVSDGNMIIRNLTLPAGETYEFGAEKFLIQNGERIAAVAQNGSRVTATITYTEI